MPPRRGHGGGRGGGDGGGRGGGDGGGRRGGGGDGGGRGGGDGGGRGADVPANLTGFPYGEMDFVKVAYLRVPLETDPDDFVSKWSNTYETLIENFRETMGPNEFCDVMDEGKVVKIRMNSNEVPPSAIYHLVLHYDNNSWVILLYRMRDMYLIGFRNRHGTFRFLDANYDGMSPLQFMGTYGSLETNSDSKLDTIQMGMFRLHMIVHHLSQVTITSSQREDRDVGTGLFLSVLMFAESSRFQSIFKYIKENLGDMSFFGLLECHQYYVKNWSKLSKVVIAAKECPEMIKKIEDAIKQGLHGLGNERERRGFPLPDGTYATSVENVKSVVRVISNQSVEDSVSLFGPQE